MNFMKLLSFQKTASEMTIWENWWTQENTPHKYETTISKITFILKTKYKGLLAILLFLGDFISH